MTLSDVPSAMPFDAANARAPKIGDFLKLSGRVRGDHTTTGMTVTLSDAFAGRATPCSDLRAQGWVKWDQLRAAMAKAARELDADAVNPIWEQVLDGLDEAIAEVKRVRAEARNGRATS